MVDREGHIDAEPEAEQGPRDTPRRPDPISRLGLWGLRRLGALRAEVRFLSGCGRAAVAQALHPRRLRGRELLAQLESAGADAMPLVAVLAFLTGVSLALETATNVHQFGTPLLLAPVIVTQTAAQRICPLLTAMILAGRSGSVFAADLGLMVQDGRLQDLRRRGLDPLQVLVLPRLLGMMLAGPLLVLLANGAQTAGGALTTWLELGMTPTRYLGEVRTILSAGTVLKGPLKGLVFATLVGLACCSSGVRIRGARRDVLRAPRDAVVHSIAAVVLADCAFTYLFPA